MSPRRLILLTAVVLVLLAFIFLFERKLPTTAERQSRGTLQWDLPQDRVETIRLERSGQALELQKTGEDWNMVRPESARADSAAVSGLLSELADLKRVEGEASEARPEDYGLKPPAAKATLVWTEADAPKVKKSRTLELGIDIPGTDVAAAREAESGKIFFVPSSVSAAMKRSADEFKTREIFGASVVDVTGIDVLRGRGQLLLARKGGAWWLTAPLTDLADDAAAEGLAGELSGLRVLDWVPASERSDLSALGLDPPLYRVTVRDGKGKKTTVDLGSTRSDGAAVYARREGQVFTLGTETVEELSKEALAFRSSQLVRFNRSDAAAVEGAFGASRHALTRKDGGWATPDGRVVLAASADDLMSALLDLKARSFLGESEAKALASGEPAATLTIRLAAGDPWTLKLYRRGAAAAATVGRRPGAFLLGAEAISKLEEAFRKVSAAPTAAPKPSSVKGKA
jgi:hypothetical protein